MEESKQLQGALTVLNKLIENGYEAYIVGGYVRDRLLGLEENDIDITTNALPEVVQELFPNNFLKNKKFSTVSVIIDEFEFEVTTYRVDIRYKDHRHPTSKVTKSLKADLKRRDFTVNALCLDNKLKVIDYLNGKEDLSNKVLRAIGSPYRRFKEDALRMFRAFRFSSKLNFTIEPKTFKAIKRHSNLTRVLSPERIRSEIEGILKAPYVKTNIGLILESNILKNFPDIKKGFTYLNASFKSLDFISFAAFISLLRGSVTNELPLSKKERKQVIEIINFISVLKNKQLQAKHLLDVDISLVYKAMNILSIFKVTPYAKEDVNKMYDSMIIKSVKDLAITGEDVIKCLGLKESPTIKLILDRAVLMVINGESGNQKDELLKKIKS